LGALTHLAGVLGAGVRQLAEKLGDFRVVVDFHRVGDFLVTLGNLGLEGQSMGKELLDCLDGDASFPDRTAHLTSPNRSGARGLLAFRRAP